jgi:hypothetical protein
MVWFDDKQYPLNERGTVAKSKKLYGMVRLMLVDLGVYSQIFYFSTVW